MILRGQLRGKVGRRRDIFYEKPLRYQRLFAFPASARIARTVGLLAGISRAAQIVYAMASRFPRHAGTILRQTITADPADYYTFVGTDLVNFRGADLTATRSLWLNVGDWREARTYEEACSALARRLGEAAQLGPSDEVLDAGFGFGDQDFFWLQTAKPKRIVGINITPIHV